MAVWRGKTQKRQMVRWMGRVMDDTVGQLESKCGEDKNVKKDRTQVGRNEDRKAQGWSAWRT